MPNKAAKDILETDKETEYMQSFVRGGGSDDEREPISHHKADLAKQLSDSSDKSPRKANRGATAKEPPKSKKRNKQREYYEEVYCDKDRAAAVSIGSFDIKQSLNQKARQERNLNLSLPEEAEPGALLALGMREAKNGNTDNAVQFITKALELNPQDQNALVARSKCYLLLGEPDKALQDSETALIADKNNIRAIYQKAESLYYLGQFEHSLMFFHRGLRLRPELNTFRLGVQKTQEAIENTIGAAQKIDPKMEKCSGKNTASTTTRSTTSKKPRASKATKADLERRASRRLLGELCVDKEYLENLLKHPNLKLLSSDVDTEPISGLAKDAVTFLNTRQEFWRQQRPCTALSNKKIMEDTSTIPKWF
ncbi:outer dynein arm-docking complex subunit 4 isoform X1 [Lutzomyia longipalpis]|uniref:outer dynein arm-docking complex subunit 4 isoform X1 n=1 Tax=Lutzomyia longipalpis TaxID=7200 RepID=UPI002483A293|nr:outer dynein arm-docking complex subunit 4 isoform X1 [Lutzomyia longipalpis]